ncbi:MAG: DNA primase [Bacteroidaceae bacterium]|nr:DNA primase [Bacteroidaceae bacterium]
MIDHATIQRIIDAANIVDVVSEYVTLRRSGSGYKGLCPFHDDTTPSFSVSPARGLCKCFACGKGGNAVHFIMEMEQLSYPEALRFLAKKYGIEIKEREMTDEDRRVQNERESMFAVNEWASNYFRRTMLETEDGKAVGLAYFRSRGFRDDILEKFRLGFCLDTYDSMTKAAMKKGFKEEFLVKTGLTIKRESGGYLDKYRGRVIFPWFNVSGKVSAFGGRVLDARTKGVSQKYINSPESEIFHKSNELYGIYQAKKQIAKEDLVYMVEGYTDVISMHQCGIENVVANSGTALNVAQIRLLHRFTTNITLLYDGDEAGIHAALRGTDMLLEDGMNVKVLLLPDGDDPDSFARKHNATEFKEYVEGNQTDFIMFKVQLLMKEAGHDPRKRSELANNILQSICVIPDEVVRSAYVHECAEQMQMQEEMLLRQCNKMRKEHIEQRKLEREREKQRKVFEQQRKQTEQHQQQSGSSQQSSASPASQVSQKQMPPAPVLDGELVPPPPVEEDAFIPPTMGGEVGVESMNDQPHEFSTDGLITPPEKEERNEDYGYDENYQNQGSAREVKHYSTEDEKLIEIEKSIMTLLVRYGEKKIDLMADDGQVVKMSVAEFVMGSLADDDLHFRHPLYEKMLQEVAQHVEDSDFVAKNFLMSSPDLEISRMASDLMSDKYQLSKGQQMADEESLVGSYINRLLLDYKYHILNEQIQSIVKQMSLPEVVNDIAKSTSLMQQFVSLTAVSRDMAKQLGDRVIQK